MNVGPDANGAAALPHVTGSVRRLLKLRLPTHLATKTAMIYAIVATLWITLSDALLFHWTEGHHLGWLEMAKGWLFVVLTAWWLHGFLRRKVDSMQRYERKLRLFIDHAPVALAMLDCELRYITVSRRWRIQHGFDDRELRGCSHRDLFVDEPAHWRDAHRRGLAGETTIVDAERRDLADGAVQWLRWEVRPWFDGSGAVGGIVVFTEDITSRMEAEQALATSRARLRIALQSGRVGTWSRDCATGLMTCDDAVANLLGREVEDFARGGVEFFYLCVHPDDRAAVRAALDAAVRHQAEYFQEYRIVQPGGCVLWLAVRAAIERTPDGTPLRINGAAVDITEMKRIGSALHESEDRFREVVETMREVFWIRDVEQNAVVYLSPQFEEVWGVPRKNPTACDGIWLESVHPSDRERMQKLRASQQLAGGGEEIYRIFRPDGSIRWVHDRGFPVRDADGRVVRVVGTAEDITARKQLEDQFLRAQRLEAIGTLASGVAHDLNNLLAPMLMIGPLLKPKLSDPTDLRMLGIVEQSAQRGADVVRQLLTFSRGITSEKAPVNVATLVDQMQAIMRETFPREIRLAEEVAPDLPAILGDTTQLHQVLMNLCVNARDAMPEGGLLTISACEIVLEAKDAAVHAGTQPGRFVVLTVRDSGHGVPPELRARVFEPFFTTKEPSKGTGLGLSTTVGIVKSHRGFVTLESEVGVGTAFHVHLPVNELTLAAEPPALVRPNRPGAGELVLVIDDEPGIRAGMQQVLELQGYRVLTAANGREGLGVFLLQQNKVRAVVTDLMMPEMGGVTLVRALRELSPELAIVVTTGLDEPQCIASLRDLGVDEILRKPYLPAHLIDGLQRELGSYQEAGLTQRLAG